MYQRRGSGFSPTLLQTSESEARLRSPLLAIACFRNRNARLKLPGHSLVLQHLRRADLRAEEAEQRQLLHHQHERALALARRDVVVRLLFLGSGGGIVSLLQIRDALRLRQLQERLALRTLRF